MLLWDALTYKIVLMHEFYFSDLLCYGTHYVNFTQVLKLRLVKFKILVIILHFLFTFNISNGYIVVIKISVKWTVLLDSFYLYILHQKKRRRMLHYLPLMLEQKWQSKLWIMFMRERERGTIERERERVCM